MGMLARRFVGLLAAAVLLGAGGGPAAAAPAPPPLLQGWIVAEQAPGRCLTGGVIGTVLHTNTCRPGSRAQTFFQSSDGRFTNNGNCVRPDSAARWAIVRVAPCTYADDQDWWFSGTLRAGRYGRCVTEVLLDRTGKGSVRLLDCAGGTNQRWLVRSPG
jgi:hypothetical protein